MNDPKSKAQMGQCENPKTFLYNNFYNSEWP